MEPSGSASGAAIGMGAYGVVYKTFDHVRGVMVALKKLRMEGEPGLSPSTLREITLLYQLRHDNVVRLFDVMMNEERVTLIFEYMNTDLRRYMDKVALPAELVQVRRATVMLKYFETCCTL